MFRQLKNRIDKIEGWLYPVEGVTLYNLVHKAPTNIIVEVGAWKGRSTCWLLAAVNSVNMDLYTIDHFTGSSEHRLQHPEGINTYSDFRKNTVQFMDDMDIPSSRLNVLRSYSIEAARVFSDGSIGMIFIDASHEYEDVKTDLEAWIPKVHPNGIIAVHDCNWIGVNQALRELSPKNINQIATLAWWYKK